MAATFDPTTPTGQCRLLVADFDVPDNVIFQDEVYGAFLNMNNQNVRLAAAQALDVVAINETLIQKSITLLDLKTNGPAMQVAIAAQAKELRRQAYEGSGDFSGYFDYAEMVVDAFTARQRVINEWLRHQV